MSVSSGGGAARFSRLDMRRVESAVRGIASEEKLWFLPEAFGKLCYLVSPDVSRNQLEVCE